jgi:hypothetical protein
MVVNPTKIHPSKSKIYGMECWLGFYLENCPPNYSCPIVFTSHGDSSGRDQKSISAMGLKTWPVCLINLINNYM